MRTIARIPTTLSLAALVCLILTGLFPNRESCAASQAKALPPELAAKIAEYPLSTLGNGTVYLNCDKAIPELFGDELMVKQGRGMAPNPKTADAIIALAERLPEGGALHLGRFGGRLDFRRIKNNLAVTGGGRGSLILGAGQKNIQLLMTRPSLSVQPGVEGMGDEPLSGLTALMGHCGRISSDIRDSAFIASVNAWAVRGFVAEARVDNCLFLWFSTNWTHADYNAHLGKPDPNWWKKNCQVHFDLKGGGKGTRVYLMIETNYGNPGTGVWLENCNGLAMYHGATERGSSQGPGLYYLKNCENVQLGLRRIFPGTRGGGGAAMPTHALTIEGGRGNILHVFSDFANSYRESLVNSDRSLQLWGASFDYEVKGASGNDILRFACTPRNGMPEGADLEEAAKLAEQQAAKWVKERNRKSGLPDTPENVEQLKKLLREGRDRWWPINARHEETFLYGSDDLTQGPGKLTKGQRLPPPPSIPATDAPTKFRPLYYTQEDDFGRALLKAGADPTGKKPSDDAFAQVMYGTTSDEVARLIALAQKGDPKGVDGLFPIDTKRSTAKRTFRLAHPPLHVPAGTFLLTKTLHFGSGGSRSGLGSMIGAGPDKTVLKFQGDIIGIKHWHRGTMANFAVEGGRVGLAVTGADHHAKAGPFQKSYIAGANYYDLTFRNQTFCGLHIGNDDPEVMGGAEFDQNKFVNLKFYNTGDYGIYMNNNMTDKWLCMGSEFVGQKQAGISIKFNNLIHGGVYSSRFQNIDGPGIDFMGGNVLYMYRPYIVMVEQCDFIECGTEEQPCLDYGYGELMSLTRCNITTKEKAVKCGYIGSAQHYEDVKIDVKLADGGAAMVLRGVRHGATARTNGHILRGVTANGPVVWVNDANSQNEHYRKTWEHLGREFGEGGSLPIKWDVNPAAGELAPPNGWVHPFIFYKCQFGEKRYEYSLINADVDAGKVIKEVDLSHLAD